MKTKKVGLGAILLILLPIIANAQTSLTVPNNTKNTRFYEDIFNIKRPALNVAGFSNSGNHSNGYGLKQILEMLYNNSADPLLINTYDKIVDISNDAIVDPFNPPSTDNRDALSIVNHNSNILQSRAFVALARYVLHQNGIIEQISDTAETAPPHSQALSDLRSAFLKPQNWLLAESSHKNDQVKWTRTIGNYARALDLYLALENAYYYYGDDRDEYNDEKFNCSLIQSAEKANHVATC